MLNGGTVIMPKLALIATIDVVEGQRDRLLPLLRAHGARSLKDEPGTLQFEALVPREDDTKLLVYEVFRDDAALPAPSGRYRPVSAPGNLIRRCFAERNANRWTYEPVKRLVDPSTRYLLAHIDD